MGICAVDEIKLSEQCFSGLFCEQFSLDKRLVEQFEFFLVFLAYSYWSFNLRGCNSPNYSEEIDSVAITPSLTLAFLYFVWNSVLAFCYCKKQIDISFLCACPLIDKFVITLSKCCRSTSHRRTKSTPKWTKWAESFFLASNPTKKWARKITWQRI